MSTKVAGGTVFARWIDSWDCLLLSTGARSAAEQSKMSKSVRCAPHVLPPCRVCGQQAKGFHYGVNTCDACKVISRWRNKAKWGQKFYQKLFRSILSFTVQNFRARHVYKTSHFRIWVEFHNVEHVNAVFENATLASSWVGRFGSVFCLWSAGRVTESRPADISDLYITVVL